MTFEQPATTGTTTVVDTPVTDLQWVTFSETEDEQPCEAYASECSNVATHVAILNVTCECGPPEEGICSQCIPKFQLFFDLFAPVGCKQCGSPAELLRIVPKGSR